MATTENANASKAVSKRMLGLSLHAWEDIMLASLGAAALAAVFVIVSTYAVVQLTRQSNVESARAVAELNNDTARLRAEPEAARLELQHLKSPRTLDFVKSKDALDGITPSQVEVLYVEQCTDCFWLATFLGGYPKHFGWPVLEQGPVRRPQHGPA